MNGDGFDPVELVQRIGEGDRRAEHLLVTRYGRPLLVLLRCWVKDPMLVEDVYQETFYIVIKRLRDRGIESPTKLASFINRTAKFVHIGIVRKEAKRNTHADMDAIYKASDQSEGPAQQLSKFKLRRAVQMLLEELKLERDKEILRRFYLLEETKQLICASMELTPANFDRVISRARQRFRKLLDDNGEE